MANKDARKQELIAQIAQGTTNQKVYEELMKLNLDQEKSVKERQSKVEGVIKLIRDLDVRFEEIKSAFSAAELREAGVGRGTSGKRSTGKRTSRRAGELLIDGLKTSSGKGAASSYHKQQKHPQYVPKAFKELYMANKDNFEAALKTYFTDSGKAYFATKDGKAELEAWIDFVKTKSINPRQA